jgi:hypothetical protein
VQSREKKSTSRPQIASRFGEREKNGFGES